jgi:hypothetical protein
MKKLLALATATAIGIGSLGVADVANAKPWHPGPYPHPVYPYPGPGWGGPGWGGSGFYFGFGFAPHYPRMYVRRHVRWCMQQYRTYNPATDTYHPKVGVTAVCVSPWWTY